jgi:DNA-binding NtrC family response regulator
VNFNVLIIGNGTLQETVRSFVPSKNGDVNLSVVSSDVKAVENITAQTPHMVVVDFDSPRLNPYKFLTTLHRRGEKRDMIVVARNPSIEHAVKCIRLGARDFIHLPQENHRLKDSIEDIYSHWQKNQNGAALHAEQQERFNPSTIIGECRQMQRVAHIIQKIVSRRWVTVLIRGETGTGKEVIARAIHYLTSAESKRPFVEVNCTAIPETLLESELFGHKKGAFTDAKENKKGLIELSQGGSLFLDEIGDMSLLLQAKLLKTIEEKHFRRLGSTETIHVKTRIIAGTNVNIDQRIEDGLFRRDLYYRLNVVTILLPPLRERGNDILLLAEYFLEKYAKEYGAPIRQLSPEAKKLLMQYDWPGNVRELQNTLERIILLGDDDMIEQKEVYTAIDFQNNGTKPQSPKKNRVIEVPEEGISLKEGEKRIICEVLKLTRGNRSNAAQILGISRPRLKRKIDEYRIS